MRLIDYTEIMKLFDEEYKKTAQLIRDGETHLNNLAEGYVGADKVIRNLPDVDAVEVVRCKDCRLHETIECFSDDIHSVRDNDFCSWGEYGAKMDGERRKE